MASVFPKAIGGGREAGAGPPGTAALRTDRAVRAILRNWRILTDGDGGERTLLACSGGADSCALVAALSTLPRATDKFVVGHVIHDLRPESETHADRDAAKALADRLGLDFVEARVTVASPFRAMSSEHQARARPHNLESAAREARYAALADMARRRALRFIATAHHADDQLETVVMSLLRGAAGGGAGVRGMAAKRRVRSGGVEGLRSGALWLVRPMLTDDAVVDRAACRRICTLAGVEWREDATNTDTSRLRAAVRHRVAPVLRELRPDVGRRAMAAASHAETATKRLDAAAKRLLRLGKREDNAAQEFRWQRSDLRRRDALLLGAALCLARRRLRGRSGEDRVSKRAVDAAVRAIRDDSTEVRRCVVGGMEVEVTARRVLMRCR